LAVNDERIRRIRELSKAAGELKINYQPDSLTPPSGRAPLIPSSAPGPVKAGLAALWSAPGKDRPRILIWLLALAGALALAVMVIAGALVAYMISRGHIPSWLE
jgi:hypothetical protein